MGIAVEHHDVRLSAGLNWNLDGRPVFGSDEDEPVYIFDTMIEIRGTSIYPPERAGERYDVTLTAASHLSQALSATLKAFHARDANGVPKYRNLRDGSFPVYERPCGLALFKKVRGERLWTLFMPVRAQMTSDAVTLLSSDSKVYISMHEKKIGRHRWIQSLSIQTTEPSVE